MSVPDWMIDTPSPNVEDMAAVIRQLVRSLRKAAPDNEVAKRAMDYLKKHGLEGSPLRATPARPQAGDAVREALERMSTLLEEHIRRHPFGNNVLVVHARNHAQVAIAQLQEKNDG